MPLSETPDGSYKVIRSQYNTPCWRQALLANVPTAQACPWKLANMHLCQTPGKYCTNHPAGLCGWPGRRACEVPHETTESRSSKLHRKATSSSVPQCRSKPQSHHWLISFRFTSEHEHIYLHALTAGSFYWKSKGLFFHAYGPS